MIEAFKDAQELGTLQTVKKADYKSFAEYLLNLENTKEQLDLFSTSWLNDVVPKMLQFTKQAYIMSKKYAVVCTNEAVICGLTPEKARNIKEFAT